MKADLEGYRVAFFGGDRRELEVADRFARLGAAVRCVGLPWPDDVSWVGNVAEEVAQWANVLVFPVGGTDEFGNVLYTITNGVQPPPRITEELLRRVQPGAVLFIGKAQPFLRRACREREIALVEFRERDDFATRNAVPSAEGAIQMAMEHTAITLHQSRAFVIGYGRVGSVLARMLTGLGAITHVVVRSALDLARVYAGGHLPVASHDLSRRIAEADVVFNTAPALVLHEGVLQHARPDLVIIDIASAPGGTDFAAARRFGIRAYLAPGLPGIVAPRTAGQIVADTLLTILEELGL
jgi:dipicolinate synthase subunit A